MSYAQQKKPFSLKKYSDTLIFSKTPIHIATFSNTSLSPESAEILKDSSSYKSIYFRNDSPINRRIQPHAELACTEIDTHIIDSYTGLLYLDCLTKDFTFFNPSNEASQNDFWEVPNAALYYQNPNKVEVDLNQFQLNTSEVCSNNLNEYFQPFFFQNEEVTNMMYRQFIYYVRDSLARTLLAEKMNVYDWKVPTLDETGFEKDFENWNLNWETKIDWEKYADNKQFEYLAELYLGESDRFYDRLEIDTRKLMFYDNDTSNDYSHLNVYPDTLCWIHNFTDPKLEANTNMYAWHPAHDNYPVVGVDWHQAKAFCSWMTVQTNKQLAKKGIPYKIKFDLPSMIQWDYVRNKQMENNNLVMQPRFNWETNLVLTEKQTFPFGDNKDTTYEYNDFYNSRGKLTRENLLLSPLSSHPGISNKKELMLNGSLPILLERIYIKKKRQKKYPNYNVKNVKFMGSSVSEWLQESYQENWQLIYYKRMELLIKSSGADTDIQALREEYFNTYHHPEGRMVIGANWYDYRDEYYEGKSFESMDAKVFADPEKGYATVGFRLIATFEPLEE